MTLMARDHRQQKAARDDTGGKPLSLREQLARKITARRKAA